MAAPFQVFGSKPAGSEGLVAFVDKGFDGDDFRLVEHVGAAGIFTIHGPEQVTTKFGVKTAVKATVVILKGQGEKYENVLIFNQVPVQQMQPLAGQTIVARIDSYESKQGNTAVKLDDATEEDVRNANAYLASVKADDTKPPF